MPKSAFDQIRRLAGKAAGDFAMITEGDRIAGGVSGGKDSLTLALVLAELRRRAPVSYELLPIIIDPGFTGFPSDAVATFLRERGLTAHVERTAINQVLSEKLRPGTGPCSFCARLRRGVLYTSAWEHGCNKVALGHHRDDFIETLLLNQFYSGTLAAMSPCMLADNGRQTVIRPFFYVEEELIRRFVREAGITPFEAACPAKVEDQKRQRVKELLAQLKGEIPYINESLLNALQNVQMRHLAQRRR